MVLQELSSQIADNLVQTQNIEQNEKEIYVFGIETMLMYGVNFISTLLIAVIMRQVWECLVFLILFMPLRSNAGGYHASSQLRCYFLSNGLVIGVLLAVRNLPVWASAELGVLLLLIASIVIITLAPVENKNKPLELKEIRVYGRRARVILTVEILLCLLCYYFSWGITFWLIVLVAIVAALSLITGLIIEGFSRGQR